MDVATILLSLEEREKWQRRLVRLRRSRTEVRNRRRLLERQLRSLRRQLARFGNGALARTPPTVRPAAAGADGSARSPGPAAPR